MEIIMNILKFLKPTIHTPEKGVAATARVTSFVRPEGGWVPMGYTLDGSYVVLSLKTGQLVTLRAQDMHMKKLQVWLGLEVRNSSMVYDNDIKKDVVEPTAVVEEIAKACDEMGLFDFSRVRGPGLYREGDDLVVNFGHQVATADGKLVPLHPGHKSAIYQGGPSLGFALDTPCASSEEVLRVLGVLASFGLGGKGDVIKLAGWLVTAFFGAALPHRPILAISAERGSGKTTLIEFLNALLGPQAIRRDGIPTTAQMIYALENRSATLIVDELEGRGSKKAAVETFMEMLRIQFTSSSSQRLSRVIGGKTRYYNAPVCVLLLGISLPSFNAATETRTVRLNLDALPEASRLHYEWLLDSSRESETVALGARLRRLLVSRWNIMRGTMAAVRPMLIGLGHEARIADKFSPLLAGYVAMTHDHVPSPEELRSLIAQMDLSQTAPATVERDAEMCLSVLLNRKVVIYKMTDGAKEKTHMTIRDALTHVVHGDAAAREPLTRQLEEFGVRPLWVRASASWKLAVCSSEHHEGMRKLMMRTDWALGGWKDVLQRLPGAKASVQKVARSTQRVVVVDMPREVLEPEDGDYDFPEPMAA